MDTSALTWVAAIAAATSIAVLLRRHRAERVRLVDLGVAIAALTAVLVVALVPIVMMAMFSPVFDVAHLLYLATVISLPTLAVATMVLAPRRGLTRPVAAVSAGLVMLAPIGWYGTHVAPYRLEQVTVEVSLPAARSGTDPIRIGVLADLQATKITSYERQAVTDLMAMSPDVILIPGDLFQGNETQFDAALGDFRALLGQLDARGGVYAVRGDVDTGDRMDQLTKGTEIRILDDEIATTRVGDRGVLIGGNRLRWAPVQAVQVRQELAASNPAMVRVLMAHRPEVILGLPEATDIDLTVAGHTHGGQIAIPGVGPIVTGSPISRSVAAGGLHDVGDNPLFVSTGVGIARGEAPQVRLFTRPMVAIVELH